MENPRLESMYRLMRVISQQRSGKLLEARHFYCAPWNTSSRAYRKSTWESSIWSSRNGQRRRNSRSCYQIWHQSSGKTYVFLSSKPRSNSSLHHGATVHLEVPTRQACRQYKERQMKRCLGLLVGISEKARGIWNMKLILWSPSRHFWEEPHIKASTV